MPHHRARTRDRGPVVLHPDCRVRACHTCDDTPYVTCALRYRTPGRSGQVSRLLDGPNTKHGQTAAQAPRAARDGLPKGRRGFMGGYIP